MNIFQYMQAVEEARKVSGEKDTYEMELEIDGLGTFRCDIKDLDKLILKLHTIGKALEGAN